MQGGIPSILAKEETNNTQPTSKRPAIRGGKQREGGGQSTTHTTPQATQKTRGEEPGGSSGQRESGHTGSTQLTNNTGSMV